MRTISKVASRPFEEGVEKSFNFRRYADKNIGIRYHIEDRDPGVEFDPIIRLEVFSDDPEEIESFLDCLDENELSIMKGRRNDKDFVREFKRQIDEDVSSSAKALEMDG